MNTPVFILGGCRSGKSQVALSTGQRFHARKRFFIATCQPWDAEMKKRVERHQAERGHQWETIEVPLALPETIAERSKPNTLILIDCLTLWVTNLMLNEQFQNQLDSRVDELARCLKAATGPVILVSNEVGSGIVPENKLARQFRDATGIANQKIAAVCPTVIWTMAGIPVCIKGKFEQ